MDDRRHVALLRAVNVGGSGKLTMADLKAAASAIGLTDVATVLQTGNLLFRDADPSRDAARRLEAALASRFGLNTTVLIRTRADWMDMLAANPFANAAARDPSRCVAMVLAGEPSADKVETVRDAAKDGELIELRGATAFLVYPDGIGRSNLTSALVERRLGVRGTVRNWNTVTRIAVTLAAM